MVQKRAGRPASRQPARRCGECFARRALAAFVEDDERRRGAAPRHFHTIEDAGRLLGAARVVLSRPALRQFEDVEPGQAEAPADAFDPLAISLDELAFGAALQAAHGHDAQPQRARLRIRRRVHAGGPRPTSSRGCRSRAPRDGRCGRARRRHRSAPSRRPAALRPARFPNPLSLRSLSTRSAIAPTCRWERPDVTIMVSAIEVLPVRSISTVFSAFMSSRLARAVARRSSSCGTCAPEGGGSGVNVRFSRRKLVQFQTLCDQRFKRAAPPR